LLILKAKKLVENVNLQLEVDNGQVRPGYDQPIYKGGRVKVTVSLLTKWTALSFYVNKWAGPDRPINGPFWSVLNETNLYKKIYNNNCYI